MGWEWQTPQTQRDTYLYTRLFSFRRVLRSERRRRRRRRLIDNTLNMLTQRHRHQHPSIHLISTSV